MEPTFSRTQPTAPPEAIPLHTGRYYSRSLGREQSYAYLLPTVREGATPPSVHPFCLLLHGQDGSYLDWPTRTRLARYASRYNIVFAFPEGGAGWYTNAVSGQANFEDDLLHDLLPHLQQKLPLKPPGREWGVGGLSMGGYGAIKLALKHPHLFSAAFSQSGALEKPRTPEVDPVFGDPKQDAVFRLAENPFRLAEQALCRWPIARPRLHLDCGLSDNYLEANRRFHGHLTFIGYPHTYREMPGYHTWPYWDRAFRSLLPTLAQELGEE